MPQLKASKFLSKEVYDMSTQTLADGNIVNTNTLYPSALLLILGIGTCVFTMFPCAREPGLAFALRPAEVEVGRCW